MADVNAPDCDGIRESVMQTRIPTKLFPIGVGLVQLVPALLLDALQGNVGAFDVCPFNDCTRIVIDNSTGYLPTDAVNAI